MGLVLAGSFILFLVIGVPVGLAIGCSGLLIVILSDFPLAMIPQTMFSGNESFALVAVPFFVLAGDILAKGGISERIVAFAQSTLGRFRGGLSIVSTVASMFIAAISGSGAATTAAVGSALLPELKEKGYDVDFSAALIAASGTIGVVIPPSVPMVLYAVIAGISVAKLFMAGFIPGILMGLGLIAYSIYVARKRGYPAAEPTSGREKWRLFLQASWGLMTPVIILGGIFSGYFTPSEAAAVAVDYSLIVAFFVYKSMDFRKFYRLVVGAGVTSSLIMFIIATSKLFGWGLAFYEIPEAVAKIMLDAVGGSTSLILLMIMVIILLAGMFMETASALIILTPIFLPTILQMGVNLVHFGVLISIGLAIGMATPPVAIDIYVASAITGLPIEKISRPIIPMVLVLIAVLLLVTYVPSIILSLPMLIWGPAGI
ncbi:MAG: TRAP transporter large permease [Synergistaceae bacterium]|jgi:C4-dicarboxylate transporter DctM subunit|uniref:TRAP transporter large permease n=1 Tax=Aminivibrio sp. TaxID=1872489 RepID=UPI001D29CD1C|nr:TRAP transporter large permease [Synergistaceae bacterium]NCC56557.1 TRAP transporter large permease [Synergistales bacterium]MDD3389962.1 TRAP transporter large permease [Synergistaceae bacterium]MDD3689968.1 TRAP transporter large permease [Synergistaceae bacterium]MDD4020368.1 TRAP transporter large permease [Synergistaceae bacterium]